MFCNNICTLLGLQPLREMLHTEMSANTIYNNFTYDYNNN